MKNFLLFLSLFTVAANLSGQEKDTTFLKVGMESGEIEKQKFIDRYDYVFRNHQPTRMLLKVSPALNEFNAAGVNIGLEAKILPAFSVHGEGIFSASFQPSGGFTSEAVTTFYQKYGLELRWYLNMKKRIARGLNANNMSGNYFSLEGTQRLIDYSNGLSRGDDRLQSIALRFGLQRRVFRYGFIDLSYGMGFWRYNSPVLRPTKSRFFINPKFSLGFALALPDKKLEQPAGMCDILRCEREENRMFKLDLYNLFEFNGKRSYRLNLNPAFEYKIGESPVSLQLEGRWKTANYYAEFQDYKVYDFKTNEFGGNAQLRWYYNLQRRIARGKSGNNLSGAYLAAVYGYDRSYNKTDIITCSDPNDPNCANGNQSNRTTNSFIGGLWGVQYRFLKLGFIEFNVGPVFNTAHYRNLLDDSEIIPGSKGLSIHSTFKAGLAF